MRKYLLIVGLLAASCAEPDKKPYILPKNAMSFLTNDSTKSWKLAKRFNNDTRMNMGKCFLSYRLTYKTDMTMNDNNGESKDCGESLQATWKFVEDKHNNPYVKVSSEQIPMLMNIQEDYKFFKIIHISEDKLTLQFRHKQFSNNTTTITDYYVPEHVFVEDRNFHW